MRVGLVALVVMALMVVQQGAIAGAGGEPRTSILPPRDASNAAFFDAASLGDYVPGELIVGFELGVGSAGATAARSKVGARLIREFPQIDAEHWRLPAGAPVDSAVRTLSGLPGIRYAEPDYYQYADVIPSDARRNDLWAMHNLGQTGGTLDADIDAFEAWAFRTDASGVVVGVIDTGVDYTHEDLVGNIWTNPNEISGNGVDDDGNGYVDDVRGWDCVNNDNDPMDDNNHGTHVSGTIGARGNNGVGVVGVTWSVRIMPLKFLGAGGSGSTTDAIECINYAASFEDALGNKIVRITSNSWGGGRKSNALQNAIAVSGALFVAAAGNSGSSAKMYPAAYPLANIISVAATDANDALASFSNYGTDWVDLGAPGVSILSSTRGNMYGFNSGTSMATPHVSGATALVLAANPAWTNDQVKAHVLGTVDPLPSLSGKVFTGGRLNVRSALGAGELSDDGTPPGAVADLAASGAVQDRVTLTWTATGDDDAVGTAYLNDIRYATGLIVDAPPVIPYLSTGYRYAVVSYDANPGFEQPGFDDSGWSLGDAGFGTSSGSTCPLNNPTYVKTNWPVSTDILLRKTFSLSAVTQAVRVAVAIDNDVQVFVNGQDISGGLRVHEGCAIRESLVFIAPMESLNVGTNLVAVRGRDRGGASYLDLQVIEGVIWDTATRASGEPNPQSAGSPETFVVPRLTPGTTYYFAMKTMDEVGNVGGMSNVASATTTPSTWNVDTVEAGSDVGFYHGHAYDPLGNPAVAYSQDSQDDVKFAHWSGASWDIETVDAGTDVYTGIDMAYSPLDGNPSISYGWGKLKFAHRTASGWSITTLESRNANNDITSLAYAPDGGASIAYRIVGSRPAQKFARQNPITEAWTLQVVDPGAHARYTDLAYDMAGNPAMCYSVDIDEDNWLDTLKYARWNGASWDIQVVETGAVGYGVLCSLAFHPFTGFPVISHQVNAVIRVALWNGASWGIEVFGSGGGTSLAYDSAGTLFMSYSSGGVRLAKRTATGWEVDFVDVGGINWYTRLQFDASGKPSISYGRDPMGILLARKP